MPEIFDSGDIVSWLRQFEVCATANSWDDAKKLKVLPAFLRGPAATYFHALEDGQKDTYGNLAKNLTQVFCPAVDREKFFSDFEERILRPNEDPSLFLWELKNILMKADPTLEDGERTALLSRQFMKDLPHSLRLKFRAVHRSDDSLPCFTTLSTPQPAHMIDGDTLHAAINKLTAAVTVLAVDQKDLRASLGPSPLQRTPRG